MRNKSNVNEMEQMKKMLKTIHLIKEQNDAVYANKINSLESDAVAQGSGSGNTQEYNIDGEKVVIHGTAPTKTELTDEIRGAFQPMVDEFHQQVSDLVEFNSLQLHENNVQWSGKLIKFDMEFVYNVGEKNDMYIKGEMIKVDEEFTTVLGQLVAYHKVWSQKWSAVLANRMKTPETEV